MHLTVEHEYELLSRMLLQSKLRITPVNGYQHRLHIALGAPWRQQLILIVQRTAAALHSLSLFLRKKYGTGLSIVQLEKDADVNVQRLGELRKSADRG